MATKTSKTVTILKLGYQHYAITNAREASRIVDLLSKLQPVQWDSDSRGSFYKPSDREGENEISVEFNKRFEPRKERLGLPKPMKGAKPCIVCTSDVMPGKSCPACGQIADR